jgi:hypothetical protein
MRVAKGPVPILYLTAALLALTLAPPAVRGASYFEMPTYAGIERCVSELLAPEIELHGSAEGMASCLSLGNISACLAPDTDPAIAEALLRKLPTWIDEGDRYTLSNRWTLTATDGATGGFGVPITLTYSFVPDGTQISGEGPSSLYAEMNAHFGDPSVWKPLFAEHFDAWGRHAGITYVEVEDDGMPLPAYPGELGVRGDVRISAAPLDGGGNTLAYSYYPNQGDMVLDTAENWGAAQNDYRFFRNVVSHEQGHGIGLAHVLPNSCTKLMEAYLCLTFTYTQDDDIRGAMRWYGDFQEQDDVAAQANDLGAFNGEVVVATPSLDGIDDVDWYHFVVTGESFLDVTLHPVGSAYQQNGQIVYTHQMQDMSLELRTGVDGTTLLQRVDATTQGNDELLSWDFTDAMAGEYWIRVDGEPGYLPNDVQRYDITFAMIATAAEEPAWRPEGLDLALYPNPFNPKTAARLYAPEAGEVRVQVYDLAGRRVRSIETAASGAGWLQVTWDGKADDGSLVASGVYIVRAEAGGLSDAVRTVLLK